MIGLRGQEHDNHTRWLICLLVVLIAHGSTGLLLVSSLAPPPAQIVPSAVMIELAPTPAPPPAEEPVQQPTVEPGQLSAPPPAPLDLPPPEPPPELVLEPPSVPEPPPLVAPEVTLPPPAEHKLPRPLRPARPKAPPREPLPVTTPPPAEPIQPPSHASASPAAASATWQSRLLAHLTRFKRYPPTAQLRREQGVALLRFSMTAAGEVLFYRLERSSGHDALDQETLELIRRSQPLPALPPEMAQPSVELVVPLRFELR